MAFRAPEAEKDFLIQNCIEQINKLDWGDYEIEFLVDVMEPPTAAMLKDLKCHKVGSRRSLEAGDYHIRVRKMSRWWDWRLVEGYERKKDGDGEASLRTGDSVGTGKRFGHENRGKDQLNKIKNLPIDPKNFFFVTEITENFKTTMDPCRIVGDATNKHINHGYGSITTCGFKQTIYYYLWVIRRLHASMHSTYKRLVSLPYGPMLYTKQEEEDFQINSEIELETKALNAEEEKKSANDVISDSNINDADDDGVIDLTTFLTKEEDLYVKCHEISKVHCESQATCFVQQLRCIPGISDVKALAIAPYFQTYPKLSRYLDDTDPQIVLNKVSKIQVLYDNPDSADFDPKTAKTKNLGPAAVKALYKYMYVGAKAHAIDDLKEQKTLPKETAPKINRLSKDINELGPKPRNAPKRKKKNEDEGEGEDGENSDEDTKPKSKKPKSKGKRGKSQDNGDEDVDDIFFV